MAIFTLSNAAISLLGLYTTYRIYWEVTTGSSRRTLAKQKGALPGTPRASAIPWFIPTFGFDIFLGFYRDHRDKTFLEGRQQDFVKANSHTILMKFLGNTVVSTEDPENCKALLATNVNDWSLGQERIKQMSSYLGYGIFTHEGQAWKHSREMLRPCFERSMVSDVSVFEKHTSRLVEHIPTDGSVVDLQPLFHMFTLDVATEFLFGRSTDALDSTKSSREVQDFIEAFEYCSNPFTNENVRKYGFWGQLLPDAKGKRSAQLIKDFADRIIDEELVSKATQPISTDKQSRYIFLDELVSATSNRTTIRSELLNILLAGRDTTAALLSNVLWELPRHPAVLSRLRAEIADGIGNNVPTYEQLKDMKYLRAIINESQRLYPIVPTNSREALCDTVLPRGGGPDGSSPMLVPKGGYVIYQTYAMHRRPDIYGKDAEMFKPERWCDPAFRPRWSYIPFSGGPRICIGQNFALTETMFVVVRLVQMFDIEGKDGEVWREKLSVTCTGDSGCKLRLTRRV